MEKLYTQHNNNNNNYLNSGLGKVYLERELLAGVDVGVMRFSEHALEFLQLRAREGSANPPLLPLLIQTGRVREEFIRNCEETESARRYRGYNYVTQQQ